MEIGKKIKALRMAKGVTQEALAEVLMVSPQAVSKWECEQATPDIQLLPEIAVYFGVTVDDLFCLTDNREFDRIQNMLWDSRFISQAESDRAERWIMAKIRENYRPADCYTLLADLYNHRAAGLREQAEGFAKSALEADPNHRGAHRELNAAMGGRIPDWNARNHHRLIAWYQDFLDAHPDVWPAYLWLLDNLMDDRRFQEAEEYLRRFQQVDHSFRGPLYRGLLAWHRGEREEAHDVWQGMLRDFGGDWMAWFSMGDVYAAEESYDEALAMYEKALAAAPVPRYVDSPISMAHVKEILGDREGAIAAYQRAIDILARDWATRTGETVDSLNREILRLKRK